MQTHTHQVHLSSVEELQFSQFGNDQLIGCTGISVKAHQLVSITMELHQTGQLGKLIYDTPLKERGGVRVCV